MSIAPSRRLRCLESVAMSPNPASLWAACPTPFAGSETGNANPAISAANGWPPHRGPSGGGRWLLVLSRDGKSARVAAAEAVSGEHQVVAPASAMEDLPLSLHSLDPIPNHAGAVLLSDFHRAFPCRGAVRRRGRLDETPPLPAVATPAYVLARLSQLGAGSRTLIASAQEDEVVQRAADLLAGRGAACQFEVAREPVPPAPAAPVSGPGEAELDRAGSAAELRRIALHAPARAVRARAAAAAAAEDGDNPVGHLLAGCSANEQRKPREAAAAFQRAIERDETLAAAHFELGKTMIVLDDLEAALDSFRRTTETLPDFAPGWANAGAALGELERADEALGELERAAGLDPLSHSLASNLGVTLRELGRLEEAERAFRRALELAPDFVFGHYNLANAVYLQGRHREAVELFEKARAMDPSGSDRQQLLLAAARLAAEDLDGALADYRTVFDGLEGQTRLDMRMVAQWDLRRLAERIGISPGLRRAAEFIRSVRA